jgi:hypothetical protein
VLFRSRLAVKGVHEIAVSSFVPLPGSAAFNDLEKKGLITVDDDFCMKMAGATSLGRGASWNPGFSHRLILFLKWAGVLQFFAVSFAVRPGRVLRLARNFLIGVQETKTDRALSEIKLKVSGFIKNQSKIPE